ncbi:hypothetical protein CAPTEDRAFT_186632 [Capitella teleta]|uniref:Uncharacterized protein n=1 Tax=Capitella teleta TaxID=283909 RepID=R7VKX6_CAPTE|nr:hypothetical protein CAPTEDRAFT_186632 [Capitella teleta]|eukprot:ELU17140.1 hypothetical protein CAPTEDRAFT_186632 [Capitella teleta]
MAQWMSDNKLKLNDNNSKVIVFNPSNTETPEHFRTFSICGTDIATKTSVEDLGVYFERNLSIEQQVKAICASCYFHLANIGAIRNSLTKDNEDDQPPFVDSESEDEETRRWRRMRRYHKKRYEYSSLNHNLHFETTADSRGEEATLTVVEEVAVEEAMTEVIDEVLEEMTEVE